MPAVMMGSSFSGVQGWYGRQQTRELDWRCQAPLVQLMIQLLSGGTILVEAEAGDSIETLKGIIRRREAEALAFGVPGHVGGEPADGPAPLLALGTQLLPDERTVAQCGLRRLTVLRQLLPPPRRMVADLDVEQDWLGKLSRNFGIPVSFAFGAGSKARQLEFNEFLDRVNADADGYEFVTGQTSIKNQGSLQNLKSKYHPFVGHPTFERELAHLSYEEKLSAMRQPEMRAQLLSEESFFADKPFSQIIFANDNLYGKHSSSRPAWL